MSPGPRGSDEAAGLRAPPHGGHEEVDGSACQEREGVLGAAAPHGHCGREAGSTSARSGAGSHQPAQQGEVTAGHGLPQGFTQSQQVLLWNLKKNTQK